MIDCQSIVNECAAIVFWFERAEVSGFACGEGDVINDDYQSKAGVGEK